MSQSMSLGESMYHLRIDVIKPSHENANVLREVHTESEKTGWTARNFVTKVASTLPATISFLLIRPVRFHSIDPCLAQKPLTIVFDTDSTHAIDLEISSPNSSNARVYNWQRSTYNTSALWSCSHSTVHLTNISWVKLPRVKSWLVVQGKKSMWHEINFIYWQAWCLTWSSISGKMFFLSTQRPFHP